MTRKPGDGPPANKPDGTKEQLEALSRQVAKLTEQLAAISPDAAPVKSAPPDVHESISNQPERFPDHTIIDRIESVLADKSITIKQFAFILGLSASAIYHRLDEETPFTIRELDIFARAVGAPKQWPFLDWETALAFERWLEQRNKS